jgi:hypothetical protein
VLEDVSVEILADTGEVVHGKLQTLSTTGGCAIVPVVVSPDAAAEIAIRTRYGPIRAIAQMLSPLTSGSRKTQAFRFVALDEPDHERLKRALASA